MNRIYTLTMALMLGILALFQPTLAFAKPTETDNNENLTHYDSIEFSEKINDLESILPYMKKMETIKLKPDNQDAINGEGYILETFTHDQLNKRNLNRLNGDVSEEHTQTIIGVISSEIDFIPSQTIQPRLITSDQKYDNTTSYLFTLSVDYKSTTQSGGQQYRQITHLTGSYKRLDSTVQLDSAAIRGFASCPKLGIIEDKVEKYPNTLNGKKYSVASNLRPIPNIKNQGFLWAAYGVTIKRGTSRWSTQVRIDLV